MREKCYICFNNDKGNVPAVAICNELNKPVCENHAHYCDEENHGTKPLGDN